MTKAILSLLLLLLIVYSCGPNSKTITPLTEADKAGIKNLAIHVQADEELKVNISKVQGGPYFSSSTCIDVFLLCLGTLVLEAAYAVVDTSIRSNQDSKRADKYEEDISQVEMDSLLSQSIDEYLDTTGAGFSADITEYQSTAFLSQEGFDALLDITIEKFEVKLCPSPAIYSISPLREGFGPESSEVVENSHIIAMWNQIRPKYDREISLDVTSDRSTNNLYSVKSKELPEEELTKMSKQILDLQPIVEQFRPSESVRFWIKFKGQMIRTHDNIVIWDREELYYDPKCEYVEDMQNNPQLVADMLVRAIQNIAVNTVNEIQ